MTQVSPPKDSSITFAVDDVTPPSTLLPECRSYEAIKSMLDGHFPADPADAGTTDLVYASFFFVVAQVAVRRTTAMPARTAVLGMTTLQTFPARKIVCNNAT